MRLRFSQAAIAAAFVALFLIVNRSAYQGFFSDDDLDNLANTMLAGFDTFWRGFGTLTYDPFNFRPIGHVTYRWMGEMWGLRFGPYIALIQCLHILNVLLIYLVARLSVGVRAAMIAATFFLFHPALLAGHWKPMYIFDLLCGLALMLAYYCYRRDWVVPSILLFWCAYKAKEMAIFFPFVLLAGEIWGQRRWWRLAPFFGISISFGGQALLVNRGRGDSAYTLRFTVPAIWECVRFYGRLSWGLPWIAVGGWRWLLPAERRWVLGGALASTLLLGPLLFLPGRLFAVYLYVPLMFGAVAVGVLVSRFPPPVIALLAIGYAAIGLRELRSFRRAELTQAQATKEFVESACQVLRGNAGLKSARYEGGPEGLHSWGVEAALRLCTGNLQLALRPWDLSSASLGEAVIRWTKMPGERGSVELSYFNGELAGDWYSWDGSFRWMGERASMTVSAKPNNRHLQIDLASAPADEIEVRLDGVRLDRRPLTSHGAQRLTFQTPPMLEGARLVEILARPTRRVNDDPRALALAVRSIQVMP